MKNRKLVLVAGIVAVILAVVVVLTARPAGEIQQADSYRSAMRQAWAHVQQADETYEFVADIEVRLAEGAIIATQTVRAGECVPDEQVPDGCAIFWSWPETFPVGSVEWYCPRFNVISAEGLTETIHVAYTDRDCPVAADLELCAVGRESGQPSAECLAALAECGIERDGRGYYNNGPVAGGSTYTRHGVFFEPLEEALGEWYDDCPVPPPTPTPYTQPTYTPEPTDTPLPLPTCLPTPLPNPTYTPLPTSTPYPTEVPYPTQPPWG